MWSTELRGSNMGKQHDNGLHLGTGSIWFHFLITTWLISVLPSSSWLISVCFFTYLIEIIKVPLLEKYNLVICHHPFTSAFKIRRNLLKDQQRVLCYCYWHSPYLFEPKSFDLLLTSLSPVCFYFLMPAWVEIWRMCCTLDSSIIIQFS